MEDGRDLAAGRVAVVTGANRGVGLAIAKGLAERGLRVQLTARNLADAEEAAAPLRSRGLDVTPRRCDVTDQSTVDELAAALAADPGRVEVLVNNAGLYDKQQRSTLTADLDVVRAVWEVNLLGSYRMCRALLPFMLRQRYGRIVNVSARIGSFGMPSSREPGRPGYSLSKVALNMLTVKLAVELAGTGVLVNAATPGRTRTRMGGPEAPRSPEEGAETPIWAALLPDDGPTGGFFMDRQPLPW
jgi:NAD(P)-dependent dehydrogenase (short-subunit alcohol dehydrogenase family)